MNSNSTETKVAKKDVFEFTLILGPPNSGKTTEMIGRIRKCRTIKMPYIALQHYDNLLSNVIKKKPDATMEIKNKTCDLKVVEDKKISDSSLSQLVPKRELSCSPINGKLYNNDHQIIDAVCLENLMDIKNDPNFIKAKIIFIKNGHYFDHLRDFILFCCDQLKKNVVMTALDSNYLRQPKDQVLSVVSLTSDLIKLNAYCSLCKDRTLAPFCVQNSQGLFDPVCRAHYLHYGIIPPVQPTISLIMGSMFSGKSTDMVSEIRRCRQINIPICVINNTLDTRYTSNGVSTHDQMKEESICSDKLMKLIDNPCFLEAKEILIEEGQFFPDLYEFVLVACEKYYKTVRVYGLDGDFMRQPFGQMLKLLPIADQIKKLKALCKECGDNTPAIYSKKIVKTEQYIVVAKDDVYQAVCHDHYFS